MKKYLATGLVVVSCMMQLYGMNNSTNQPNQKQQAQKPREWVLLHNNVALLLEVYKKINGVFDVLYKKLKSHPDKDVLEILRQLANLESLRHFANATESKGLRALLPSDVTNRDIQLYLKAAIQTESEKKQPKYKICVDRLNIPTRATSPTSPFPPSDESGERLYLVRSPVTPGPQENNPLD
jgi:hypothetical protein